MVVDFSPDERAFLSSPHAQEALGAAGVNIEDLRPRALESFDEATRGMRAQAYEARRKYLWRLVRDERSQLEAKERKAAQRAGAEASAKAKVKARGSDGSAAAPIESTAGDNHARALQQMVAQETRALERELRAEAQRERLQRKQEQAAAARAQALADKERQRMMREESRQFLGDLRSARRELEEQSASNNVQRKRAASARGRPSSAPPARPSSGMAPQNASLKEAVRLKAKEAAEQRAAKIAAEQEQKDAAFARRREQIENERALKRLYAEQVRLRHEERLAGVQLQTLEQTMKTQRELEEKQNRAERERAAQRAAVGKVSVSLDDAEGGTDDFEEKRQERTSKVLARAAQAEKRLEQAKGASLEKERMKQQRAAAAREERKRQEDAERQEQEQKNYELAMRRAQRLAMKQVAEEVQKAKTESAAELAAQRSAAVRERAEQERQKKRLEAELKQEMFRENAERVRRASEYKAAQVEASIHQKNLRYEQRSMTMEEGKELRLAFSVTRARQQSAMHNQMRASSEKELQRALSKARTDPDFDPLDKPPTSARDDADGQPPRPAAAKPRPKTARPSSTQRARPAAADDGAFSTMPAAVGGLPAGAHEDAQERAAFGAIEKLRAQQNKELREAVESEQKHEAKRAELLASTPEGPDRVRLQKLLKLERERADGEMMALAAEHELALAQLFKKTGVTR